MVKVRLADVQTATGARVIGLGLTSLAHLTHQAELADDDVTFLAIQEEVERRDAEYAQAEPLKRGVVQRLYRDEYLRVWRDYAEGRP